MEPPHHTPTRLLPGTPETAKLTLSPQIAFPELGKWYFILESMKTSERAVN